MPKYPRRLSSGANNTVIVLSDTEVAKLLTDDTRSDIGSLVAKFTRLDFDDTIDAEMLVMERIYPIDFRAYEAALRTLWLDVFEDASTRLHKAGFVHRDLKRPYYIGGLAFDNILFANTGLRLIDVGISALKKQGKDF